MLPEHSYDNDSEGVHKYCTLVDCNNNCGFGFAMDGPALWSKPHLETFEMETVIELTDEILQQFLPSKPKDKPFKGFKLFFTANDEAYGLWLPQCDLVKGRKLYVAVPRFSTEGFSDEILKKVATGVLTPEDIIPARLSVQERVDEISMGLPGMERLRRLAEDIDDGEWDWDAEVVHHTARILRWDSPPAGAACLDNARAAACEKDGHQGSLPHAIKGT